MGFFNKKDDTVMLPEKFKNSVIYPISNSMYTVNLGQNIVVGDGWNAVFVVKEKPREILPAGAHELSLPNLPNITRLLKLDQGKVNKKSDKVKLELPHSFKCDIYYVNTRQIDDFLWKTGKVPIRSKLYGKYKINLEGTLDFSIVDSSKFVSLMLIENSHVRLGKGEKILSGMVNEEIAESILFSNFFNPRQFADKPTINEFLLNKLNENFEPHGLHIAKVDLQNVEFFGKVTEQIKRQDETNLETINTQLDDVSVQTPMQNLQSQPQTQQVVQNTQPQQEEAIDVFDQQTERVVVGTVKQKQNQSIMDVQTEINQSLFGTSRVDVGDTIDKIKLENKDKDKE